MKILFIIAYNIYQEYYIDCINTLKNVIDNYYDKHLVDIACINSNGDFTNIEGILSLKFKIKNPKLQFDKICDFISSNSLDYDWFIKLRPDIKIFEPIDFSKLDQNAINARARVYTGNLKLKNAASVGGKGIAEHNVRDTCGAPFDIVMDDIIYIFHKNVILNSGFSIINDDIKDNFYNLLSYHPKIQHEWFHTYVWNTRKIPFNIISINMCIITQNGNCRYSGDIN